MKALDCTVFDRSAEDVAWRTACHLSNGSSYFAWPRLREFRSYHQVFKEQVSAVSPQQGQLEAALDYAREGDVLVVTTLDRLARSVPHLCAIGSRLDAKGVGLKVLDQPIDTTTSTGRLMFNMLGAIAQFERELIRERMLVGIAKAKAHGKYKGRAPTAKAKAEKVKQLRDAGVGPSEIARQLGISRTSVFRILTAA